jgi:putative inorganic carbon (hco3(-)) transporter
VGPREVWRASSLTLLGDNRDRHMLLPILIGGGLGAVAAAAASEQSDRAMLTVLVLMLPFLIAIVGDLRRILLALVLLDIPFQWDKYFGYREDLDQMAALGGWGVSLMTVALVGLYAIWIARALVSPETAWRPRLRAAVFPSIFLAFLIASLAVAQDRVVAGFQIALYAQMLLLFVYIASTVQTRSDLRFVVVTLLIALCLESLVTLAAFAAGGSLNLPGLATDTASTVSGGESRVTGTMHSPNNAGAYFAFMFAVAAALYMSRVDARISRLALAGSLLALVTLGLTLSRGAWLACLVSIVVLVLGFRGTRFTTPALVAFAVAVMVVFIPLLDVVSARLTTSDEGAAAGRVPLIEMSLEMIRDNPLLGVGANNFALEVPGYAGGEFASAWLSSVHHKYLLIWSEAGAGALVAFLLFIGATIGRAWRIRNAVDPLMGALGLGIAAAVVGHAVHMNFDIFAGGTPVALLWVAAAIVASPAMSAAPHAAEVPASAGSAIRVRKPVAVRPGRRAMA